MVSHDRPVDCRCGWSGTVSDYDQKDASDHSGKDYTCPKCGKIHGAVDAETVQKVEW